MVQVSDDELISEFSVFDVNVDDDAILDKLKQFCVLYRVDSAEIATEWVAYSHNKGNCLMNADGLEGLERDRLVKTTRNSSKTPNRKKSRNVRHAECLPQTMNEDIAEQLLGAYYTPNNKTSCRCCQSGATFRRLITYETAKCYLFLQVTSPEGGSVTASEEKQYSLLTQMKRTHTPEDRNTKRLLNLGGTPTSIHQFSPASFSPLGGKSSQDYGKRSNAAEVVCSVRVDKSCAWAAQRRQLCSIALYDKLSQLNHKTKYMFQKLTNKALVLNDQLEYLTEHLKRKHQLTDIAHVALPAQEPITVIGRICCDSNGKLNCKSVMLEGSRETSSGKQILLDLSAVQQYSLFPGQIVALNGVNNTGKTFVANKVYEGVQRLLPEEAPNFSEGEITMVVAAGPFTTSDSLSYEPLNDLITYLVKQPPDVCILMGPFVDVKHPEIEKLTETFQSFFLSNILKLAECIKNLPTQLVILPAQRDAHHDPVYPQPPFEIGAKPEKIHFMPDPCMLNIDGVLIGVTSTDILLHLGREEISCSAGSDRLRRLTEHLLTQYSLYPLYPADDEMNIDYELLEQLDTLPVTPHLMFLPSDLRYFIKDINGCCCVNPGRLAKGRVGGTYSRVIVRPSSPGDDTASNIYITAEVVRI